MRFRLYPAALIASLGILSAQTAGPRFEAASIKPSASLSVRHVLLPPVGGRLHTNMAPLKLLIENAYGVPGFLISGGPDWIDSTGFDIDATAGGNPSRAEVWLMLRSLLEERFQLKVHREMRLMPVYDLSVAPGGAHLPEETKDCAATPGPCGDATLQFDTRSGLAVIGRRIGMADLAKVLSAMLLRPVVDKTGIDQRFDVLLPFAYEEGVTAGVGNPWRQSGAGPSADPTDNATITAALRRTLGLRLETAKGQVETLVVDGAKRPSEN